MSAKELEENLRIAKRGGESQTREKFNAAQRSCVVALGAPSTICVEPNDAIIKALFQKSSGKIIVKEKRKTKKKDAIFQQIGNPKRVLGVIISEQVFGNHYTTVNIIHRALIGKPGQVSIYPRKNQKEAIIHSVEKPMGTVVDFSGAADSLKEMKYTNKESVIYFKENSPRVITLKKYVMRRICEIKLHKNLAPTITFDDVFFC